MNVTPEEIVTVLRHHEIAEANHRILDPLVEGQLRLLGEIAGVGPGTRVLDLACGKGEMVCRWAEWFGASGVGVDLSHVFTAAARERAAELGVASRVSIHQGDAAAFQPVHGAYDIASCLGATWIGNGIVGTIELLKPAVRPGGLVLVGEPFLLEPAPAAAYGAWGFAEGEYLDLAGTLGRLESAGVELLEMVVADHHSWDRYEASQWITVADWLAANPDDPERDAMGRFVDDNRRTYLTWGRRFLGWAVFVTRPR